MSDLGRKRTKFVTFSRQLWPQPPEGSKPYWCYINTLMFKEPFSCKTVWEQEIPEAAFVKKINRHGYVDPLESRWSRSCKVEYEPTWGWCLILEMAHTEAEQVWSFVMNDLDYTKLQHYDWEKEAYLPQTRYSINNGELGRKET